MNRTSLGRPKASKYFDDEESDFEYYDEGEEVSMNFPNQKEIL